MPRLPPSLLRRAHHISPHLATLLPACRDLESARNELRWIRQHVVQTMASTSHLPPSSHTLPYEQRQGRRTPTGKEHGREAKKEYLISKLCAARARHGGYPLQYVLGSQPFGTLDIKCSPGVLIPRPETEAWVYALADEVERLLLSVQQQQKQKQKQKQEQRLNQQLRQQQIRIVDFCTGTGCVALLLSGLLMRQRRRGLATTTTLRTRGFDVAPEAVALARENLVRNAGAVLGSSSRRREGDCGDEGGGSSITFRQADLFSEKWLGEVLREYDGGGEREVLSKSSSERTAAEEPGGPVTASLTTTASTSTIDILVSNPPYISLDGFNRSTARSVRNHEPRLALVPDLELAKGYSCKPEDVFYARLLEVADVMMMGGSTLSSSSSSAKKNPAMIALFEVGDLEQAIRVAEMAAAPITTITTPTSSSSTTTRKQAQGAEEDDGKGGGVEASAPRERRRGWDRIEIWRDDPGAVAEDGEVQEVEVRVSAAAAAIATTGQEEGGDTTTSTTTTRKVSVRGNGNGRAVLLVRGL